MGFSAGRAPLVQLGFSHQMAVNLHLQGSTTDPICLTQDTQGFPLLQRDLQQVEQLSQKLKSKARRVNAESDSLAAARLLAQEGVSAQKYEARPARQ